MGKVPDIRPSGFSALPLGYWPQDRTSNPGTFFYTS